MLPLFRLHTQGLPCGDHDSVAGNRKVAGLKGLNSKCSLFEVQIPSARFRGCPQIDLHDESVAQHNVGEDSVSSIRTPLQAAPLLEVSSSCAAACVMKLLGGYCIVQHGSRAHRVKRELTKKFKGIHGHA